VETNFFPLWEYERGKFRFTRPIDHPKPVEEYLGLSGKYSHLNKKQIGGIKKILEKRCDMLRSLNPKSMS
jgi:phenylglyoxylate dehydrogenase beta subunit